MSDIPEAADPRCDSELMVPIADKDVLIRCDKDKGHENSTPRTPDSILHWGRAYLRGDSDGSYILMVENTYYW